MARKKEEEIIEEQNKEEGEEEQIVRHKKIELLRIIGGRCEFCGKKAEECEELGPLFKNKKFRCLCGGSNNPHKFSQSIYKYWKKLGVWICNTETCRRLVENMGGYQDPEILNFYL